MKKKLIMFLTCCCILIGNTAYADNLSISATTQTTLVTDTNVKVVKYVDGEEVILYTGPVSQYDNGIYSGVDFSESTFVVIIEWENPVAVYYVYPIEEAGEGGNTTDISQNINTTDNIQSDIETSTVLNVISTNNNIESIEYDIIYDIVSEEKLYIDADYNIYNVNDEAKCVSLIAALYDDGKLCDIKIKELNVEAEGEKNDSLKLMLPADREGCYVKLMVWDSIGTLKPIGSPKSVKDLDVYSREKYLYITTDSNSEFNIFMNSTLVQGANSEALHTIKYDSLKIIPIDLCGLTNDKELEAGRVAGTNITIRNAKLEDGNIQYGFEMADGRNTGVANYIKFKANTELNDEPIIYTIQ